MKTKKLLSLAFAIGGFLGFSAASFAAAPLAGTAIGNQARAIYTAQGENFEVFSNTVTTRVSEVYGLTLVSDNSRYATPGQWVFFPHSVTNVGNAPDTFALTATQTLGAPFNFESIVIYLDADQDGLPDNYTPLSPQISPTLAAGGQFHFVVGAKVPDSAALASIKAISVTATSQGDALQNATNTDTVTITNDAVIGVTKAIDVPTGAKSGEFTYTLTYTNTGNAAATAFVITDNLPAGLIYVVDGSTWNTVPYSDNAVVAGLTKTVPADETGPQNLTWTIANVAAGQSGTLTFKVKVAASVIPLKVFNNTATFVYESGGSKTGTSNTVPLTIVPTPAVTLDPPGTPHDPIPAGGTATWRNALVNTGDGIDTFDITFPVVGATGNDFPVGTTFQLFQSDGQTPMQDTNGNGIPDTGPIAPGGTYDVVIKAKLPANASGGPFSVTKTATSTTNPTVKDDATDTLTGVTAPGVDLTIVSPRPAADATHGAGPAQPPDDAHGRQNTNPGTTVDFPLFVNNTGGANNTFNLSATGVPAGWSVVFVDALTNQAVTNTGVIGANGNKEIIARVTVPANAPATPATLPNQIIFAATSPVSGSSDTLPVKVGVNVVRGLSLQTNHTGQTFPGGSVVYDHVLTNIGNVPEGGVDSDVVFVLANTGTNHAQWTTTLHHDANNNGQIDAGELPFNWSGNNLSDLTGFANGLPAGQSIRLLVKVVAPLGIVDGSSIDTRLTATTTNVATEDYDVGGAFASVAPVAVFNIDTTSIVRGDLSLIKEQAVSLDNNATFGTNLGGGGAFVYDNSAYTVSQVSAPPGSAIIYRITVTNTGSVPATGIVVYDTVPAHTAYNSTHEVARFVSITNIAPGSLPAVAAPVGGTAFTFNVGTLNPTESAVISFRVLINE